MLLLMKPHVIHSLSSEIAFGLHDLLRTNAANIHKADDWFTLFSLLEVVGAAAHPPPVLQAMIQNASDGKPPAPPINRTATTSVESENECSETPTTRPMEKDFTSDAEVNKSSVINASEIH